MNGFWASENCDAFIVFVPSQPGKYREIPTKNGSGRREQIKSKFRLPRG
jgi:hypothetical protein